MPFISAVTFSSCPEVNWIGRTSVPTDAFTTAFFDANFGIFTVIEYSMSGISSMSSGVTPSLARSSINTVAPGGSEVIR
jgi:hypothetical protein